MKLRRLIHCDIIAGLFLLATGMLSFRLALLQPAFSVTPSIGRPHKAFDVQGVSSGSAPYDAAGASYTVSSMVLAGASLLLGTVTSFRRRLSSPRARQLRSSRVHRQAGPVLYGSQGSRSPLVNWYLYELGQEFEFVDAGTVNRNSVDFPHPFGQIPALRDGDLHVFESGAILMYIADKYGGLSTPEMRAEASKWVLWANATLDPICFLETEDGKVYGTGLRGEPRALSILNNLLSQREFLLGDTFSVADVAVGAYLLYVPQFFPDINVSKWPSVQRYMKLLCERPAYARAFGAPVAMQVAAIVSKSDTDSGKLFGLF